VNLAGSMEQPRASGEIEVKGIGGEKWHPLGAVLRNEVPSEGRYAASGFLGR